MLLCPARDFLSWQRSHLKKNASDVKLQTQSLYKGLITRAISCVISCAICCISQMRFAASAIWCPTRNYRLQVPCDFACNLLCDLVHAIWCMQDFCATAKRIQNRTPNCICDLEQIKIESDSCRTPNRRYTKSHLRYAANRT
jgi:hypothetical protein